MEIVEGMFRNLFKEVLNVEIPPLRRMPFSEAMDRFGSDKPDMRISLELVEVSDLMKGVESKIFSGPANDPKSRVAALRLPEGGNKLSQRYRQLHAICRHLWCKKGLPISRLTTCLRGEGLQSPILKFLPDDVVECCYGACWRTKWRSRVLWCRQGQDCETIPWALCASNWDMISG